MGSRRPGSRPMVDPSPDKEPRRPKVFGVLSQPPRVGPQVYGAFNHPPRTPERAPRQPPENQKEPQESPGEPQDSPRQPPEQPQESPRHPQDSPKMAPKRPQESPRNSKNSWVSLWALLGPSLGSPWGWSWGVLGPISGHVLGPFRGPILDKILNAFWPNFGAILESILGPDGPKKEPRRLEEGQEKALSAEEQDLQKVCFSSAKTMIRECWRLPSQAEEAREGPPEAPEELQELKGKGSSKWNGFWAIFGLVLGSESGS